MKMKCTKCGAEVTSAYCSNCGAPAPKENLCPKCGTATDAEFCPNCGTRITASAQATVKTGKKYTIFNILSIIFAALTFLILLFTGYLEDAPTFDLYLIFGGIAAPIALLPMFNFAFVNKKRTVSTVFSILSILSCCFMAFLSIRFPAVLLTTLLSIVFSILAITHSKNIDVSNSKARNVIAIVITVLLLIQIPYGFLDNKVRKESYIEKFGYIDSDRVLYHALNDDEFNVESYSDFTKYVPTEEELKASEELGLTSNTTIYRKEDALDNGITRTQQFDINKNNSVEGYAVQYAVPVGDPFIFTVLNQLNTYYNDNYDEDIVFKDTESGKKYNAEELSSLKDADHLISAYKYDDDLSIGTYVSLSNNTVYISIMYTLK